ncbi:Na(+)-translocating NADH-quinone reductase subunit B, partial [methanotrophic bacterial endosymbiont of Bathymodiolus sp.]
MNARSLLDSIEPIFIKGGKLEKYYGLYEMVDTFIYTPADVTRGTTHVRDGNDLKRTMTFVVIATFFAVLMAMYNSGYQANLALEAMGLGQAQDWRSIPMSLFGYSPMNPISNFVYGALFFIPIYLVTLAVGGVWEVLFATVRGHEVNEGFLVSSMLYTLILPPDMPLWQVALGISFGIVIGKEVFGGTGKNFLNPALTGRAFLFFA